MIDRHASSTAAMVSSPDADPSRRVAAPIPRGRGDEGAPVEAQAEPVLCGHCGRTASNGISCQGMCVADSGY